MSAPANYRGRRTLVTGVTGFIGRWVARALSDAGAEVVVNGRDAAALRAICDGHEIRGTHAVADLSVPGEFARLYRDARPEITFNLAGYGIDREERDEHLAAALNTRLPEEIAQTIAGSPAAGDWRGLQLVHAGSAFEYGSTSETLTESSSCTPTGLYGRTKLEGTLRLRVISERTGLRATTARLFTVYGPGEHANRLLPSLLRAAHTGESLPMTGGKQQRDFTFVGDVAEGLLRLGALPQAPPIVNLASGKLTGVREFVETAALIVGLKPGQLQLGALPYRADEVQQGVADTTLLASLIGWLPPRSPREGIEETVRQHSVAARR